MERFAGELRIAFFRYITSGEAAHLDQLGALASDLGLRAATLERNTSASPETAYGSLLATLDRVRLGVVAIVAVLVPLASGFTLWAGRRYQRALKVATTREGSLLEANRALARRNDQFHGMYQVVTEVTESLSMKYVVETTVREARQLVAADLVVLHVVEGEHLMLAGSASDEGVSTGGLLAEHVELGEGLVGRAAKRGRTLRLQDVSNVHGHGPALPGAQSGIVVPLIVGARVVGTVSCWAKDANAFSADDERVLEMMASQVATAIAAADVYEETDRFAHRDGLTELPNRRQLTEDIKYEFDRAVRRGREMTVAMIDVDHFKRFNDDHGHHAGDVALQRVAKALAEALRAEDRLYRYGGEEFAIVLDRETGDQAVQIAERLRAAVSELTPLDDQPARVTISVGLASAPEHGASFDELIESADEALYEAKEHGRNRVVCLQIRVCYHPRRCMIAQIEDGALRSIC
ncbi:MAG: sensor domain-containing diguanylate cyclase [Dehalococcoidia bacterium]|nr:sensor domain-containing diguanylate cyclase [Dehalococcoidia bacterium]